MTRRAFLVLTVAATVTGCQSASEGPPQIRYGRDLCAQCGMIISEVRFAAAYLTRQGEWRLFDDLGDMLEFSKTSREDISVFWVHDYESEAWLKAESAIFVESAELHTPMGYGIVALGHRERAERLAHQTSGEILSFAGLLAPP